MEKQDMFLGAPPYLFEKAKDLRLNETPAEKALWAKLSGKQLGVRFRRQHPLYAYVVDFYCHSKKVVVEVDGPIHLTKENVDYDKTRTEGFEGYKIKVLRFTNERVLNDIDSVIEEIKSHL